MIDERWLEIATDTQAQVIQAVLEHGSILGASTALSISPRVVRKRLDRVRARWNSCCAPAAKRVVHTVNGEVRQEWVTLADKSVVDRSIAEDVILKIPERFEARRGIVVSPAYTNADLLSVYVIGDGHIGLFCNAAETGRDFDLATGQRELRVASELAVRTAAPSQTALIINVGDLIHADNYSHETSRHKHKLDVSGKWPQIAAAAVDYMFDLTHAALQKHEFVHVINVAGNHDDCTSVMLNVAMRRFFKNDRRVFVQQEGQPFFYFKFGKTLIGTTHGHLCKLSALPNVMSVDQRVQLADVDFRHWYTGHRHTDAMFESGGCVIETVRTLAPRDAYSHGSGWRSGQDLKCDTFHRQFGRIGRAMIPIQMVQHIIDQENSKCL